MLIGIYILFHSVALGKMETSSTNSVIYSETSEYVGINSTTSVTRYVDDRKNQRSSRVQCDSDTSRVQCDSDTSRMQCDSDTSRVQCDSDTSRVQCDSDTSRVQCDAGVPLKLDRVRRGGSLVGILGNGDLVLVPSSCCSSSQPCKWGRHVQLC